MTNSIRMARDAAHLRLRECERVWSRAAFVLLGQVRCQQIQPPS